MTKTTEGTIGRLRLVLEHIADDAARGGSGADPYTLLRLIFEDARAALRDSEPHSRDCPVCGRPVRIYVPAGGDGSAEVFIRHKRQGKRCDGSGVPADGPDAVMRP